MKARAIKPSPFLFTIMYSQIDKLVSAIRNDVVSGLRGYHTNISLSDAQLADDIIDERLQVIKEYTLKGILPARDLYLSINCIPVDCKNIEKCRCNECEFQTPTAHFEIPQLLDGLQSIDYLGSVDKQLPFLYYTSPTSFRYHKYKKRGKDKPYVCIDTTPNENGMYDCFVFNAPLLSQVSITAIFKDPRQLEKYDCCQEDDNMSFINNEIKRRLTEKKIRFYRQLAAPLQPNNQTYS